MRIVRLFLFPISVVYALVVYVRNFLFDLGIFKAKTFKTPTICVGNLSVGGTGKTPMIEYLIKLLSSEKKVAVLSRGYGRKSKGFQIANAASSVELLGDEPYQIYSKFPEITVAVDGNRSNGIKILEETLQPDIILLDDAFQHRKVSPNLSILVTAYTSLYVDDWYLPTGSLRDAKNQSKRATIIVVTKCPETISEAEQQQIIQKLKPLSHQKVLFSFLNYAEVLKSETNAIALDRLKDKEITLVTGIANPAPLVSFLLENGIKTSHLSYRDHHFFTEQEITLFNTKDGILTTEKDYVRLKGKVKNVYYLGIAHQFIGNGKQLLTEAILRALPL